MRFFLFLLIFNLTFSYTTTLDLLTKFNITIKTPGKELAPTQQPYKSIHVKYTLPNSDDQWNIVNEKYFYRFGIDILVAIEPFIRLSNEVIQQMTVHLCQVESNTYQQNNIWYDDKTNCNGARSMLIYEWTSYSPIWTFQIADDLGFQLDKSKFIVLTIIYSKERQLHTDQTGIILYISTLISRFYVGTIVVGNKRGGTRFSCRSLNHPRLLYAVKPLFPKTNNSWWHIYVIRNRNFGRKLVQSVLNSTTDFKQNKTDIEILSPDIFIIPGDYIIIECKPILESNCKFFIFYTYKNIQYKYFDANDDTCQDDNYPDLFKLIPSKIVDETNQNPPHESSTNRTRIFSFIGLLLFVIWISIIIGCIIMRRIRGLVNIRTEPVSPSSGQTTKPMSGRGRASIDRQQKIIAEGDHTAQLDIEHMGLMS